MCTKTQIGFFQFITPILTVKSVSDILARGKTCWEYTIERCQLYCDEEGALSPFFQFMKENRSNVQKELSDAGQDSS